MKLLKSDMDSQGQPRTKEHVEHLLARYEELQASTAALRKTIEGLNAQIPTHQAQRTDEYQSVKQAEQSVREIEGRVAEARRKVSVEPSDPSEPD